MELSAIASQAITELRIADAGLQSKTTLCTASLSEGRAATGGTSGVFFLFEAIGELFVGHVHAFEVLKDFAAQFDQGWSLSLSFEQAGNERGEIDAGGFGLIRQAALGLGRNWHGKRQVSILLPVIDLITPAFYLNEQPAGTREILRALAVSKSEVPLHVLPHAHAVNFIA